MSSGKKNVVGQAESGLQRSGATGIAVQDLPEVLPHVPITVKDNRKIIAKPIDIYLIYPDPAQPRRVLPAAVREIFPVNGIRDFTAEQMQSFFGQWCEMAGINPMDYLDEAYEAPEYRDPVQVALVEIIRLAMTIRRDKLLNPISVFPHPALPGAFVIDTGERRWLAFHLLYLLTGDEHWQKIPAQDVVQADVWRQADENNARADLTPIGKARQLALLLMDVFGAENFQSIQHFEHERHFYAQVGDGTERRIPKGVPERLAQTMGLASNKQVRDYRALLRLPDEAWTIADDRRISEGRLRILIDQAGGDSDALITLLKQDSVPTGALSTESDATPASHEKSGGGRMFSWSSLYKKVQNVEPTPDDLPDLENMRAWIDEQINRLRS